MRILSSTTEKKTSDRINQAQAHYMFALGHYNKSIQHLMKITHRGSTSGLTYNDQETLLLANVLFIGLCCIQGDIDQAANHAHHNAKLFNLWKFWEHAEETSTCSPSTGFMLDQNSLNAVITFFEYQLANRLQCKKRPTWITQRSMIRCSSRPFQTVTEAYFEFQPLLMGLLDASEHTWTPPNITTRGESCRYPAYISELGVWRSKFDQLVNRLTADQRLANSESISVLDLMYMAVEICKQTHPSGSQLEFDSCNHLFRKIADQAETLYHELAKDVRENTEPSFSYSLSVGGMFYFAAMKCRDGVIRRRLIQLFKQWPRNEGLWNNKIIASICETTMLKEERPGEFALHGESWVGHYECACVSEVFICENHRVCHVAVLSVGGRLKLLLKTVGDCKMGLAGTVEEMGVQ